MPNPSVSGSGADVRAAESKAASQGVVRTKPGLYLVQTEAAAHPIGTVGRRYRRIGLWLAASDALCVSTALLISYSARFGLRPMSFGYVLVSAGAPILWIAVFFAFGLYAPQHLSAAEIFRRTIGATSIGAVLLALGSFWSQFTFSRAWVGMTWFLALVFELGARRMWAWRLGRLRRDGSLSFSTLIVGTDEDAPRLARALEHRGSGYTPVGFVSAPGTRGNSSALPWLGSVERLDEVIRSTGVECVFVASMAMDDRSMLRVTQAARQAGLEIRVAANLPQILTSRLSVQQVGPTMALSLKPVRLTGGQALAKRAFDLVLTSAVLLLFAPLLGLLAVTIAVTSGRPILFRQRRVTRGGRIFTVYKFRTMMQGTDRILADRMVDPTTPFFKLQDDPRLTRFGSVIRRLSLDELPQLFNVLKGDMSLVGPRPLPAEQVEANPELLGPRLEVLAGLTGWWQINGRSSVTVDEAIRFDVFYIENWSLALDLYILLKSVGAILAQRGAY
jgi:exopolysaccharide biosynthesis polyprenyl glycosylphosphotransferase